MAGQIMSFDNFKPFLRHEIGEMQRIVEESRKFTVLFFKLKESKERVADVLKDALRHADVIFEKDGYFFLVLPSTDKEGAMHVARLLETYFGEKIKDVATTWPEDGKYSSDIINSVVEYVRSIHNLDLGHLFR